MIEKLVEQIEARFAELEREMSDPEVIGDRERYARVGRAYRELAPAAKLATDWRRAVDDAAGARELIGEDGDDPELREMLAASQRRMAELEEDIRLAMVERDPNDDKNVIVEVRAGAGATRPACGPPTCSACCRSTPSAAGLRRSRSRPATGTPSR